MVITKTDKLISFTNSKETVRLFALSPLTDMLNPQACIDWLITLLHPHGPVCPDCQQTLPVERVQKFNNLGRVQCKCGKRYTALSKTILEGAKISPEIFFLLNVFFAFDLKTKEIVAITGLSRQVIAVWRRKISIWHEVRF